MKTAIKIFRKFTDKKVQRFGGKKMLLVHIGRCGSTVLANMLQQVKGVQWEGEHFQYPDRHSFNGEKGFKDYVQNMSITIFAHTFGFELKPYHLEAFSLNLSDLASFFSDWHVVLLKRDNLLNKIVSSDISMAKRQWHVASGVNFSKSPVHLDTNPNSDKYLLHRFQWLESQINLMEQTFPNAPILVFEKDVLMGPEEGFQKVMDFLDLKQPQVQPTLSRTNPESQKILISNYDEVCELLKGTKYERFIVG